MFNYSQIPSGVWTTFIVPVNGNLGTWLVTAKLNKSCSRPTISSMRGQGYFHILQKGTSTQKCLKSNAKRLKGLQG